MFLFIRVLITAAQLYLSQFPVFQLYMILVWKMKHIIMQVVHVGMCAVDWKDGHNNMQLD